jgi:hypothetical protein
MTRFFFHYRYGDDKLLEDRVGIELPDPDALEHEARSIALEILTEELTAAESVSDPRCIEVEDEAGDIVLYLPFWAALAVPETWFSRADIPS